MPVWLTLKREDIMIKLEKNQVIINHEVVEVVSGGNILNKTLIQKKYSTCFLEVEYLTHMLEVSTHANDKGITKIDSANNIIMKEKVEKVKKETLYQ